MSRACTLCTHPKRSEIDSEIAKGASNRIVADRFGLSATAVHRHKQSHIAQALAAAEAAREVEVVERGGALLSQLDEIEREARRLGKLAEETDDFKTALQALREWTRVAELRAKVQGELQEGPSVQIAIATAPDWVALRGRLLTALDPYPEARVAVLAALGGPGG